MMQSLTLLVTICFSLNVGSLASLQPDVTVVEKDPATRVCGSLSMPEGSPWCDGMPTYWLVGHQKFNDTPSCLSEDGKWEQPFIAVLDWRDDLNSDHIDRHDCVHLDVNHDGLVDVQCIVGAEKGTGHGYNELYLTQEDGSLVKVLDGGGLQTYTTLRTRHVVTLTDATDGGQLLFIAVQGHPRTDGEDNTHHMFKNVWKEGDDVNGPYFEEVEGGPWIQNTKAHCLVKADIKQDGFDDIIMCNGHYKKPSIFIQNEDGTWGDVELPDDNAKYLTMWRNVRVADVTGDGIPDLLVAKSGWHIGGLRIFKGISEEPYFDFNTPYFEEELRHASPDLEVVDINNDGLLDVYVVQRDQTPEKDNYCASNWSALQGQRNVWWEGRSVNPPASFVPPNDEAQDVVFVATTTNDTFYPVHMEHSYPGCGGMAQQFGDNRTLLLAQGSFDFHGYNLLLQWPDKGN